MRPLLSINKQIAICFGRAHLFPVGLINPDFLRSLCSFRTPKIILGLRASPNLVANAAKILKPLTWIIHKV
jgi:hypothetical protein